MKSMNVGYRLSLLVVLFAFLLVFIGGMGLYGLSSSVKNLGVVYEDRLLPASQLGLIARSLKVVALEFFSGLQHSSESQFAAMHNHPLSERTTSIRAALKNIDQEWANYMTSSMDAEEKVLAAEFNKVFGEYREKIILPTLAAMEKNELSGSAMINYVQRRGDMGKKLDDLTDQLLNTQRDAGKMAYVEGLDSYNTFRTVSASVIFVGVLLGILGAWLLIRSVTRPLKNMRDAIVHAQETCDFTHEVNISQNDEIGQTVVAFNKLQGVLRNTLGDLRSSITSVTTSSQELSVNADQSANAAKDTSESATYMASAIQQMTVSISHVGENSKEALQLAKNAGQLSNEGGEVIRRAVDEINKIAESVREVSVNIHNLGTSSQNISSVIRVIKEIADKINLLSLNAAIEAARAGESGGGFAVVADEVRKLAEHTAAATLEIEEMVLSIQSCSKEAISSMEQAVERVDTGVGLAGDAGEAIIKIRNETDHVMQVVRSMDDSFLEQVTVSNDIAAQVERVAQAAEQTSASSRNSSESANELGKLSEVMLHSAEKFHV